eukprot:6183796-Pleurochrysis_carterae.AAC.1
MRWMLCWPRRLAGEQQRLRCKALYYTVCALTCTAAGSQKPANKRSSVNGIHAAARAQPTLTRMYAHEDIRPAGASLPTNVHHGYLPTKRRCYLTGSQQLLTVQHMAGKRGGEGH